MSRPMSEAEICNLARSYERNRGPVKTLDPELEHYLQVVSQREPEAGDILLAYALGHINVGEVLILLEDVPDLR